MGFLVYSVSLLFGAGCGIGIFGFAVPGVLPWWTLPAFVVGLGASYLGFCIGEEMG